MRKLMLFLGIVFLVLGLSGTSMAVPFGLEKPTMDESLYSQAVLTGRARISQAVSEWHAAKIAAQNLTASVGHFQTIGNWGQQDFSGNTFWVEKLTMDATLYDLAVLTGRARIQPGLAGGDPVPAPVPEPATMLLLGSGLIGLATFGRKRFFKGA